MYDALNNEALVFPDKKCKHGSVTYSLNFRRGELCAFSSFEIACTTKWTTIIVLPGRGVSTPTKI